MLYSPPLFLTHTHTHEGVRVPLFSPMSQSVVVPVCPVCVVVCLCCSTMNVPCVIVTDAFPVALCLPLEKNHIHISPGADTNTHYMRFVVPTSRASCNKLSSSLQALSYYLTVWYRTQVGFFRNSAVLLPFTVE